MENYRLLIVDNNQTRTDQIRELLKERNFDVSVVAQGDAALREIREDGFNLIVTNILLEDMDGVELVVAIQELRPQMPVVIMSGPSHASKTIKALYAGAHHFIREPFEFEDLIKTIESLLRSCKQDVVGQKVLPFLQEQITFRIPSDLSIMGEVAQYINDILIKVGLLEVDDIHLRIALVEAITNAVEHGNKMDREKEVEITAEIKASQVIFSVKDQGEGFDYKNLPDPTEPENLNKVRGRGVFLIHKIMDQVHFNPKGNQITMIKRREL